MKLKVVSLAGIAGAVALASTAGVATGAPTPYKVTGGGQTLLTATSSETQGPGDTVTFQAFINETNTADDTATGHVNIIDREDSGKTHLKGAVNCAFLVTDGLGGGYAELYGTAQNKAGDDVPFQIRIRDNGQGGDSTDMVEVDTSSPDACNDNTEEEEPEFYLARGNAKIHKQNPSTSKSKAKRAATGASLAKLAVLR